VCLFANLPLKEKLKMKKFFYFLFVILVLFCQQNVITKADDRSTLELIMNSIDSNYGGIYSWSGDAIVRSNLNAPQSTYFANERFYEYEYHFTFDKRTGNYISLSKLKDEYAVFGKKKSHILLANNCYMKKGQEYYNFMWWHDRGVATKIGSSGSLIEKKYDDIHRMVQVSAEDSFERLPEFFSPFEKYNYERNTLAIFRIVVNKMNAINIRNLEEFKSQPKFGSDVLSLTKIDDDKYKFEVQTGGSRYRESIVYIFDKKQGYNLVSYSRIQKETKTTRLVDREQWDCQYEKIDTFWIPKKTISERYNAVEKASVKEYREVIDWTSHQINKPIPDSTFTLQNLGVCRGDLLNDKRIDSMVIISGDEFPPPPHLSSSTAIRKPYWLARLILIGFGTILLLAALVRVYLKWRSKRKEVK
jgi:hypothetical protein